MMRSTAQCTRVVPPLLAACGFVTRRLLSECAGLLHVPRVSPRIPGLISILEGARLDGVIQHTVELIFIRNARRPPLTACGVAGLVNGVVAVPVPEIRPVVENVPLARPSDVTCTARISSAGTRILAALYVATKPVPGTATGASTIGGG